MNKILLINTLHKSQDDRTYYHHAFALSNENVQVFIFSSLETKNEIAHNIHICSEKISTKNLPNQVLTISKLINKIQPSIVICDSPTGVFSATISKNSNTIIYDVTEWIPSKKHLKNTKLFLIPFKFFGLLFLNFVAGLLTYKFIFGEYHKSKLFKPIFWKKRLISTYFPDLIYIKQTPPRAISEKVRLYYSGWFNAEKGFDKVLELSVIVANANPTKKIELQITGAYSNKVDSEGFESIISSFPKNTTVISSNFKNFEDFCEELKTADIFLDLRKNDFENTRCLPIKLFYYLACGRPVVYTGLRAIKDVLNLSEVGYSFENNDIESIANGISNYISNSKLYLEHCERAKQLSENQYNWEKIKPEFVNFVLNK